jgi:hypothetical protein
VIRPILTPIAPVGPALVPPLAPILAPLDARRGLGLCGLREHDADVSHRDEPGRQQRRDDSSLHDSLLVYR